MSTITINTVVEKTTRHTTSTTTNTSGEIATLEAETRPKRLAEPTSKGTNSILFVCIYFIHPRLILTFIIYLYIQVHVLCYIHSLLFIYYIFHHNSLFFSIII